jgi:group I intron endonuclease
MIGLYAIVNKASSKAYVGSSFDVRARWASHISKLIRDKHHNKHLQSAWNKHGAGNFEFRLLKDCQNEEESAHLEQCFLECFFGKDLYNFKNMAFGVGSGKSHPNKGKALSDAHKKKVSDAMKGIGRPHKEEVKKILKEKSTKYKVLTPDGVFIGLDEAANFYKVTETTIRNWCIGKRGKCPKAGFARVLL